MRRIPFWCVLVALTFPLAASAQKRPAPAHTTAQPKVGKAAPSAAPAASAPADEQPVLKLPPGLRAGPAQVDLGEGLTLSLPQGQALFDAPHAKQMLQKGGTKNTDGVLGVVVPLDEHAQWLTVIRFAGDGYIKDSEKLDAKEIFDSIKEGTEELNEERKSQGIPPLFVDKWFEEPRYDRAKHHMVWGLQGHTSENEALINYNTHVLGRRGYVSLNLVSEPATFTQDRAAAGPLLDRITFKPGDRYEDFKDGTDKVAEYGLAGLVLGGVGLGAAKLVKIGLLAKFSKVLIGALVAGKKLIAAAVIGLVAAVKKLFGRKDDGAQQ